MVANDSSGLSALAGMFRDLIAVTVAKYLEGSLKKVDGTLSSPKTVYSAKHKANELE